MAKSKGINLLPQEEFDASMMGRLLKWATGTFRIIVIITEMIVMGAFLSRFWLDAQNSDLTEAIDIKSAQVEAQADFEKDFRLAQKKLSIFKTLGASTTSTNKFSQVTSKIPQEVVLSGMSISDNSAQVKGVSTSELAIAQFITNLSSDKTFKDVNLESLGTSKDDPNSTEFIVDINY